MTDSDKIILFLDWQDSKPLDYFHGCDNEAIAVEFVKSQKPITDNELFEKYGWTVECESPLEVRTDDGSFATMEAAHILLDYLREVEKR